MDYRTEAQNLIEIKKNLRGDPGVIIPQVYLDRTSRHVLTLEYIPGIKITDTEALNKLNFDRARLVVRVHSSSLKCY